MLASIFASLLMSINVCGPVLKTPNIKKASAMSAVSGSYCLKDSWDTLNFDLENDINEVVFSSAYYNTVDCYAYDEFETGYELVESISIHYYAEDHNYHVNIVIGDDIDCYIFRNENLQDMSSYFQHLILYFDSTFYIPLSRSTLFFSLFTNYGNAYSEFYRGYYSFVPSEFNHQVTFEILGPMLVDSSLYDDLSVDAGVGVARNSVNSGETVTIYENLQLKILDPNIYLDGVLIPTTFKIRMQRIGIFGYVRDNSYDNATFSDLLFSVMDTPIYFITRLLSFELFGVDMFVAFTGLLTICVLLFLIRKFF